MNIYSYRAVLQKIKDQTKYVDIDAEADRCKRLIYEAALNSCNASSLPLKHIDISISGGLGCLPCDIIRPLRFVANGHVIDARIDATTVYPPFKEGFLHLEYYGLETMLDNGEEVLAIKEIQLNYCTFYTICTILLDMLPTMPSLQVVYEAMERKKEGGYSEAISSNRMRTITSVESSMFMMRNGSYLNRI